MPVAHDAARSICPEAVRRAVVLLAGASLVPVPLMAVEPIFEPPTSVPGNYNRIAIGHIGSIEEGAVLARGVGPESA